MNRSEIAMLLGACAARDQRTVGDMDVMAWLDDLGDLDFQDAREAVSMHFRESTDRIMPAHIRKLCRIVRDKRRAGQEVAKLPPGKTQDDPLRAASIARNRERMSKLMAEIAAKRSVPKADADPARTAPVVASSRSDEIRERALARAAVERRARKLDVEVESLL
jgi:hypothetical protein